MFFDVKEKNMNLTKVNNNVIDLSEGTESGKKEALPLTQQTLPFPINVLVICTDSTHQLNLSAHFSKIKNLHIEFIKNIPEQISLYELVLIVATNDIIVAQKAIKKLANGGVTTILLGDNIDSKIIRTAMQFHVRDIISFESMEQELFNTLNLCANEVLSRRKIAPVITIINGKSGSGASFITGCLGEVIADLCADEIVLVDADLHYGSLTDSLQLETNYFLNDALDEIDQLDNAAIKSMMTRRKNLSLLACKPYAQLESEQNKNFIYLEPLLWKIKLNHDLVLSDLSRGLETLTLPMISLSKHILIVVQQNIVSLREAKALLEQLTKKMNVNIDNIIIIVNRYSNKVSNISLNDIKKALGINIVFCVSNNYQLASACTDLGSPLSKLSKNKTIHHEICTIIDHIYPIESPPEKKSFFKRIFRRL